MTVRFTLERVSGPDEEPVTLAELKLNLREFASVTDMDANLSDKIVSAREWVEDFTGRALYDQTWRLTLHGRSPALAGGDTVGGFPYGDVLVRPGFYSGIWGWSQGEIRLRKSPLLALTKFVTVDGAGVETDIDPATYALREADSKWPRLVALDGATWSTWMLAGDLRIEFRAGFIDQSASPPVGTVPRRFREAIMLYVESLHDRDEKMMDKLMLAAENVIRPERADLSFA